MNTEAKTYYDNLYCEYCKKHVGKLQNWAQRNDISTRELAKLLNLSSATIVRWFRQQSKPVSSTSWNKIRAFQKLHETAVPEHSYD